MMQGTPYVYQGEELGMTNYPFKSLSDYRDLESINAYHEWVDAGVRQPEELLEAIAYKSRDNARTPMQWDDSPNAGFTTGTPWIAVNPNYTEINAREQLARPDSVFHYYQKLVALQAPLGRFRADRLRRLPRRSCPTIPSCSPTCAAWAARRCWWRAT